MDGAHGDLIYSSPPVAVGGSNFQGGEEMDFMHSLLAPLIFSPRVTIDVSQANNTLRSQ
jgi:hypothetical protein